MRSQVSYIVTLAIFIACCFPIVSYGQIVYDGQVVDKNTEFPVAGVTVQLLKAKIGTVTSDQGYFMLSVESAVLNDTLIFSAVGYRTFRLPVSAYRKNLYLLFHPTITALEEVGITNRKLKDIILNKFVWADIVEDRGPSTWPFSSRYAFAKLFTAPNGNMVLKSVELGRRDFNPTNVKRPLITSNVNTRFLLHVMAIHPVTGAPANVLFTKKVSLTDNALLIRIDLSNDDVVLANNQFYVAVEWLREPYNEVVKLDYAPKVRKVTKKRGNILEDVSKYNILYQPALVAMRRSKPVISWLKVGEGKWVAFNSVTRNTGSDIALSVTVHY